MTNFRNLNEALEALKGKAIVTKEGSFIKLADMEELLAQFVQSKAENKIPDGPKTFEAAKRQASQDPAITAHFEKDSVSTYYNDQSIPIASEGVKS